MSAIGPKLGICAESLRNWTKHAQIDANQVSGATSVEHQRIKGLEGANRDLKEANEILKGAVAIGLRRETGLSRDDQSGAKSSRSLLRVQT